MNNFIEIITDPKYSNLIKTVLTLSIGYIIRGIITRLVHRNIEDMKLYYKVKRIITYSYFSMVVIFLIMIWIRPDSLGTYFGLASAGIAIALKDLIVNIAAWLFIMIKKPFVVGDRVELQGQSGDVIDQRLFQFTIMEIGNWVNNDQSTGRMIHMPNSIVFTHPLANFTSGFRYIWNEVHILITFESDFKKAKTLFLEVGEKHALKQTDQIEKELKTASKRYMIFYNNLTPIVYTDVKDSGVMLSIRHLVKPQERRIVIEKIWEDVLEIVQKHDDIDLAYNTVRMLKDSE